MASSIVPVAAGGKIAPHASFLEGAAASNRGNRHSGGMCIAWRLDAVPDATAVIVPFGAER